jgi:hypothetical protein
VCLWVYPESDIYIFMDLREVRKGDEVKTLLITATLEYDDVIMHDNDPESKEWFMGMLKGDAGEGDLILHSNEIGDSIGVVKVISMRELESEAKG